MAQHHDQQTAPTRPSLTPAGGDGETLLAVTAGLMGVVAAMAMRMVAALVGGEDDWSPLLGWLVAGFVAGGIVRRRATAYGVAVATVAATTLTGLAMFRVQGQASALPDEGTLLLPLLSALACLLGASAAVEAQRLLDARRRRR